MSLDLAISITELKRLVMDHYSDISDERLLVASDPIRSILLDSLAADLCDLIRKLSATELILSELMMSEMAA